MKFTAGYLLGGLTVVGLGVSFVGGLAAAVWLQEKKSEAVKKADETTLADLMRSFINAQSKEN